VSSEKDGEKENMKEIVIASALAAAAATYLPCPLLCL